MNEVNCQFCQENSKTKQGITYGKPVYQKVEFYDWIRKTKKRKTARTVIYNLWGKHPRLKSRLQFRNEPEEIFDFKITYCPKCGRKLVGDDHE